MKLILAVMAVIGAVMAWGQDSQAAGTPMVLQFCRCMVILDAEGMEAGRLWEKRAESPLVEALAVALLNAATGRRYGDWREALKKAPAPEASAWAASTWREMPTWRRLIVDGVEYAIIRSDISAPAARDVDRYRQRANPATRSEIYTILRIKKDGEGVVIAQDKRCVDAGCGTDEELVRREVAGK